MDRDGAMLRLRLVVKMAVIPRVGLEAVLGCCFNRTRTGMCHERCLRALTTGPCARCLDHSARQYSRNTVSPPHRAALHGAQKEHFTNRAWQRSHVPTHVAQTIFAQPSHHVCSIVCPSRSPSHQHYDRTVASRRVVGTPTTTLQPRPCGGMLDRTVVHVT